MASSVTEENITKLREAGYLAENIAHRLPTEGHITPMLKSRERVVFLPHFVRGLGFPLHPFIRGIMYYYGLDFHDLALNFVLNISGSSPCARPSSASNPTSGYGSKSSM